jgi:hypothetical protein
MAQRGAVVPTCVDESVIRRALGGTLHPDATVVVEPFTEGTKWWQQLEEDARDEASAYPDYFSLDATLKPWRYLMNWFPANRLACPSFVRTDLRKRRLQHLGVSFRTSCLASLIKAAWSG